jgi:hypothetical protein
LIDRGIPRPISTRTSSPARSVFVVARLEFYFRRPVSCEIRGFSSSLRKKLSKVRSSTDGTLSSPTFQKQGPPLCNPQRNQSQTCVNAKINGDSSVFQRVALAPPQYVFLDPSAALGMTKRRDVCSIERPRDDGRVRVVMDWILWQTSGWPKEETYVRSDNLGMTEKRDDGDAPCRPPLVS